LENKIQPSPQYSSTPGPYGEEAIKSAIRAKKMFDEARHLRLTSLLNPPRPQTASPLIFEPN